MCLRLPHQSQNLGSDQYGTKDEQDFPLWQPIDQEDTHGSAHHHPAADQSQFPPIDMSMVFPENHECLDQAHAQENADRELQVTCHRHEERHGQQAGPIGCKRAQKMGDRNDQNQKGQGEGGQDPRPQCDDPGPILSISIINQWRL
jgi:hypothetical protein|tara:strand:- start:1450 stop:1887 length:438 start_codon:yes stop_codon:yes gene_type:complete